MRIGEFSKLARVTIRLLRHYDEIGLLKPDGIDEATGYREYSVEQLPNMNKIMLLKELGLPLADIKTHIENNIDNAILKTMLETKQQNLLEQIEDAQMQMSMIDYRLSHIEDDEHTLHHINIKESDAFTLVTVKKVVPHLRQMKQFCYEMYKELYDGLNRAGVKYYGNEMTQYHGECYHDLENVPVEVGIQVEPSPENYELLKDLDFSIVEFERETTVASLIHNGPFMTVEHSAVELIKWIVANEYTITGSVREWHLSGPAHTDGVVQDEPIIELQVPINIRK